MAPDDEHSISFTLKAGQKLCVKDLPCGLAYQFQEELPPGWTPAFENAGGTIAAQSTASARCSNRYEPGKAVATIAVAKKMNGQTPEAGQFVFELVDDNEDSPTYKETLQTLLNQPSGNVVFYPVFTEAGTYHYIIREVQNRLVDYVDRDGNIVYADSDSAQTQEKLRKIFFNPTKYHVKVDVKEKEHGGETTLSTAVTCDEGEVVFNNASRAPLKIRNVPEGLNEANKDSRFTYKVRLTDDAGTPLDGPGYLRWYMQEYPNSVRIAIQDNGEYKVHCKPGETIIFPQFPVGIKYEIEEVKIPGGWTLKSLNPAKGEIKSTKGAEAVAVNSYLAKGSVNLIAHKRMEGETIESGAFRFQLIDMNGKVIETAANSAMDMDEEIPDPDNDGHTLENPWYMTAPVIFEPLEFEKEGVYTYKIMELPGQDPNIRYDRHEETVTVLAKDRGDGHLETTVIYADDEPLFTNTLTEVTIPDDPTPTPTPTKVSGTLLAKITDKGSNSLVLTWNKVNGAEGYDIFFIKCGKQAPKKVKTIKGNKTFKWMKGGLTKGKAYKAVVKAYVMKNGKKTYVRTSPIVHAYTSGGTKNYTNSKSVTVKKTSVLLKAGKTYKIKAGVTKLQKGKKLMPTGHAPVLRYVSGNKKIATVSKSGKIKAKSKGSCKVYVIAVNGARKAVHVTVK